MKQPMDGWQHLMNVSARPRQDAQSRRVHRLPHGETAVSQQPGRPALRAMQGDGQDGAV
jgi:hypothetical protein